MKAKVLKKAPSLKYKDLLAQSEEEISKDDLVYKVRQSELQLQADILETERQLVKCKGDLAVLKRTYPLSPGLISSKAEEIESLEKGLAFLDEIKSELF